MRTLIDDRDRDVQLEVIIEGAGPDVVLLPSALRGADDFAQLQADLTVAGFRSIAVNLRGAGKSSAPATGLTLRTVADDVAAVIQQQCGGRAHVVGHALGNIIARATASYRPEVVRTVTTMPSGGHNLAAHPVAQHVLEHFVRCHDETLPDEERKQSLGVAFFAPGNDPSSWLDGWWLGAAEVSAAARRADPEEWWRAGNAPLLVIQPLNDAMASPAVGREVAAALGDRVTYVEVPDCGHAILPEQPALIAEHIVRFLRAHA